MMPRNLADRVPYTLHRLVTQSLPLAVQFDVVRSGSRYSPSTQKRHTVRYQQFITSVDCSPEMDVEILG